MITPVPPSYADSARGRMSRLNITTQLAVIIPVGTLLVVLDSQVWWEALVLTLGLLTSILAVVLWARDDIQRFALPLLGTSTAVWTFGALVSGSTTAFYSITVVGPLIVPQLRRHRIPAAVGVVLFVAAAGASRLLVSQGSATSTAFHFVLVPTAVMVVTLGFMFANDAFYRVLEELDEAREHEAELAVARERIRFASELHDIQGHTLHVVKLKTALAEKLVRRDAGRAEEELREIHALVGDTIRQTKELAYAQRRLNLAGELENAKNLFEAAGIRVRIVRTAPTGERAGELLGQVLRETTTNILRHAQAGQVRITLSESGITIVNDGASGDDPPELRGLSTLRDRLAGFGGELTATQADGEFTTAAVVPSEVTR
ncbi:sensor histidine kinase [Lentzea sp. NPDC058436]|uniref:sensor histidine kinase n=1 Tax=Lentzea sp. NPDC058436 TaxID=3346499 RepID=UPI003655AE29